MLSKLFGKQICQRLLFIGYLGLATGLPLSKVVLSLSTMWILLVVLLEGDFKTYFNNIRKSRAMLLLLLFLLLHLASFLWSSDMQYALHDLNGKLPLYAIPLVFVAMPLENRKARTAILLAFLAAMLFTSFYNFGSYQHWWGSHVYDDIRGMSLFLSHIRYSLMVTMSAAIAIVWMTTKAFPYRWAGLLLFAWFGFYTFYAQILSGVMTFVGILIAWLVMEVIRRKNKWFTTVVLTFGLVLSGTVAYGLYLFFQPQQLKISLDNLPYKTKSGNLYFYHWDNQTLENGYPMYYFLCQEEMRQEWNKRSALSYDSLDRKGQLLEGTIIRYVTSKGLRKDAEGIQALSKQDVKNIENGIATIVGLKGGLSGRLSELRTELFENKDPNGQSVSQRFVYWKTGWELIRKHWLTGVGAGDIDVAYQQQYELDASPLKQEYRLRSHNQFMSYAISLGIFGLVIFTWILVRFWALMYRRKNLLALLFMTISILSFLVEDTLETQMGVTFFAFFYGFFLSEKKPAKPLDR